jgi:cytochrome bd-type quinol oxidase subunit 2
MYVWSKRLVIGLLATFVLALVVFLTQGQQGEERALNFHMTSWIILNYVGLVLWIFVWMIDQTRMRGKNVWLWLLPFLLAPLPTLMVLILFLQRRMKV